MHHDSKELARRLLKLAREAQLQGRLIEVQELSAILGLDQAEVAVDEVAPDRTVSLGGDELTLTSGQLRAVMKEMHDRGMETIGLHELLDRLRVGPLQRPASEYVDVTAATEGGAAGILRMLRRVRRR